MTCKTLALATIALALVFPTATFAQHKHDETQAVDHGAMQHIETKAIVNSVDTENHTINVSHEPIPALSWPAMTMDFNVAKTVDLASFKTGDTVTLSLMRGEDGIYMVHSVKAAPVHQH